MRARLFETLDQMFSAEGLASIIGSPVESVERGAFEVEHFSGNSLESVRAMHNGQEARFVLKRFSIERDWIMRLTHDTEVREVALFRGGVFARMPDLCIVPTVAAARDGKSWASLMVDVSGSLVPSGDAPIDVSDFKRFLDHLAVVHARFMEDESLLNPSLGLSALRDFILILSPSLVRREIEQGRTHPVLEWALRGWEIFDDVALPEAARIVKRIQQDLRPLLRALARAPRTLVHGDFKFANLGSWSPSPTDRDDLPNTAFEPRTIVLDWQDATFGSPLLDIAYFLAINSARLPVTKEEAIQMYRDSLASFGYAYQPHAWARDLEVGLLAGGAMRLVWQKALGTQSEDLVVRERESTEVRWWSEQIVRGSRWLV
jgi:hypothetical protein